MDGIIQMLPPFLRKYSTYVDFEGQSKSERIFQVILVVSAIIGFVGGYFTQKISIMMYTIGVGFIISCFVCLPPWPMFRRHSLNWQLDVVPVEEPVSSPNNKKENKKRR